MQTAMTLDRILERLRSHEGDLRARGVAHAAVFGSVARGEAGPASDVDVLVEIDPEANVSLLDYVNINYFIEDILDHEVDLANRRTLKPLMRDGILAEAVDAF